MKFTVFSALALLISAVSAFHIVPPKAIVACDPLIVFYDTRTGIPPFSLSFHNNTDSGGILAAFTNVTGISYTWDKVTIAAGTNVVIVLADSSGLASATPVITVSAGSSDTCLNNPTSIPSLPTVTSERPPTSSIGPSDLSSILSSISSSISSSSSTSSLPTTTTTPGPSTDLSSSLSSLSSVISSASSLASSLTVTTSTSTRSPGATGGLSDNGAVTRKAVGFFTISVISAFAGALLA